MEKNNTNLKSKNQLNLFLEECDHDQVPATNEPQISCKKEEVLQAKIIDLATSHLDKIYERILNRTMS